MNRGSNKEHVLTQDGIKVLSLFDGMACGMLALIESGINVNRYVAYEIDKYAIQTVKHNFPFIEERGDVFQADYSDLAGEIDIVIFGSPCTFWSVCQKQNRETVASGLGWELFSQGVRAIKEVKPKYFIYENNKSMSKAIRDSIDSTFGFEAIMINSSLVSGQHRQRLYWVGKRNLDGTYSKVDVQQPEDRGIMLQDVLDGIADRDKARTMLTSIGRTTPREYSDVSYNTLAAEPVNIVDGGKSFALKSTYYKSATANFLNGGGHYPASGVDSTRSTTPLDKSEPVRVGTYPNNAKNQAHDSQQYRIYSITAKSVTLCGNGGGMGAKTGLYAIPIEFDGEVPTRAISGADGKAYDVWQVSNGEIFIKDKQYPVKLQDGYYIVRKLTVNECKRLQTVPEWYEFPVSDTQAYKMLGNGWTVSVIAHLLNAIKKTHHNE